jgi:beta-RFAP synthase
MTRLRLQTASRLHFGLLGWGPGAARQFGGVGLMVEAPGIALCVEPAADWDFAGPLSERVRALVDRLRRERPAPLARFLRERAARIEVLQAPAEHVGLGVGTQLDLAVVRSLLELEGTQGEPSAAMLAAVSGRGRRSGIGLHGFLRGGLIVDGGRRDETSPPPLVARWPFPEDWSVLILQPPDPPGRSGPEEVRAFAELPPPAEHVTDRLCRLVLLGILPAVSEGDLAAFGASVNELQQKVGEVFAPSQGGRYANPKVAAMIETLTSLGLAGAGQSSWGPTVYAFAALADDERTALTARLRKAFDLRASEILWTRARNEAAALRPLRG